ncbi:MAG TPA: hypothetical protein VHU40_14375 [Polyangia bacterium]|jgi:hypothetical protein|nr:hypothetical protein [Polyangia bacterium]
MKRRFALTCLTVTLVATAIGCGPKKSLRAKKARSTDAEVTAGTTPTPAVPPAASAPVPPVAVTPAGAGGAPGAGMAVVILMLPPAEAAGATGSAGASRTYKLSLSADSNTAVVQVDGQPAVTAPVQRVYPAASPPRVAAAPAVRAPALLVPRPAAPVRPRLAVQAPPPPVEPMPAFNGTMEPVDSRTRPLRRTSINTAMRPPLPPPAIMNPNGAPIID